MEVLGSLFETVACFGAFLGRSDEKIQEMGNLIVLVESISASVKAFAGDLLPEEREDAFRSNAVFAELVKQMKLCEEVINKRFEAVERAAAVQARALPAPFRVSTVLHSSSAVSATSSIIAGLKQGIRSWSREGVEAMSGKLGSLSNCLQLPEDELVVMQSSSKAMRKLVPLLNLAISTHTSRGRRRISVSSSDYEPPESKRPRHALQDGQPTSEGASASRPRTPEREPNFFLQLVSDSPVARTCELPALTAFDLRPARTNLSTTSLDTTGSGSEPSTNLSSPSMRKLFGRHELRERVPRPFMLPVQNGAQAQRQHVSRFVSRDLFLLEEKPQPPLSPARMQVQASLEAPTLEFGGDPFVLDDSGTLPMGGAVEAETHELATAKSLCKTGLHCRSSGETLWRWVAQDTETALHTGDRIALLLESPPGSFTPGPARDLEAHEVTCLLGVEFRLHKHLEAQAPQAQAWSPGSTMRP